MNQRSPMRMASMLARVSDVRTPTAVQTDVADPCCQCCVMPRPNAVEQGVVQQLRSSLIYRPQRLRY